MASDALIGGGAAVGAAAGQGRHDRRSSWPRSSTPRSSSRSSSISGRRGAARASSSARSSKRRSRRANGAVRMVKLNIDENPEIAQQMRIQSIPAVYAFKDGRPVDGFVGARAGKPGQAVRAAPRRRPAGPSPIEEALAMAKEAPQSGDHDTAAALFTQILQREPDNADAIAGLARALSRAANSTRRRRRSTAPTADARRTRKSRRRARRSTSPSRARRRWLAPANCARGSNRTPTTTRRGSNSRRRCSARATARRRSTNCWTLFKRDRNWDEQAARKQLVKFFEAMGPTDPLTLSARKRLSSLMFS